MAKKRNTVGGPRSKQLSQADLERRAGYLSKSERERRFQQRVLYIVAGVAIITAVIVIAALFNDEVVLPRTDISTVNGDDISVSDFERRVQFERFNIAEQVRSFYNEARAFGLEPEDAENQVVQIFQQQLVALNTPTTLGGQVLDQMEREKFISQQVENFDLSVDEATIEEQVAQMIVNYTGRSLTQTPSATPSLEPSATLTPFVSATPSATPTETLPPSETPIPTAEGCAEGEECPTVTPAPSSTPTTEMTPTETPTETPSPTASATLEQGQIKATVDAFRNNYFEEGSDVSDLNEEAIRSIFRAQAEREVLRDHITSNAEMYPDYFVGEQATWVDARHILIQFPEGETVAEGDDNAYFREAQQVLDALNNGESFAALAIAHSDDGSAQNGGELNWSASTSYVEEFADAVETGELGAFLGPIRTQFGYHIIQVQDRELRESTPSELENQRETEFNEWLDTVFAGAEVARRENWEELVPDSPSSVDLLGDILPILSGE